MSICDLMGHTPGEWVMAMRCYGSSWDILTGQGESFQSDEWERRCIRCDKRLDEESVPAGKSLGDLFVRD